MRLAVASRPYWIEIPPDDVRTCSSGPPPRAEPLSVRLPIVPVTVTGKSTSIDPELEFASTSMPWVPGTSTVTWPDDDDSRHSRAICPSMFRPPLDVEARTPPLTPRTRTEPELDEASTSPAAVCVTSMLPLLVWARIAPPIPVPAIDPLPVEASNSPPIASAVIPPDPVLALTRPPERRTTIEPEPLVASTPPVTP